MTATREQLEQYRFDADAHEYTDHRGRALPHITGMLERCGWIDARWYTEESCERGTMVHRITADYDMGALKVDGCVAKWRPWLLSYAAIVDVLKPKWDAIEAPAVHPTFRFGGRPDRSGRVFGIKTVAEIKSNNAGWNLEKAHPIQLALQAILLSATDPLPAEHWNRIAVYLRPNGKYRAEHYKDKRDFDEAYRIIARCCK